MEDLAGLLAAGERAAFRGTPASGLASLDQAIELAHVTGREAEAASATWLLGVCYTAVGRFATGLEVFATLRPMVVDGVEPHRYASLAAAASASAYRTLGQHHLARSLDEEALGLSFGVAAAVFDARLGLASDAVGLGDPQAATEQLALAAELAAARPDWWRQRVRRDWTRAELGISQGRSGEALGFAIAAVKLAEQSGAPRHVAKSLLFVGVCHVLQGDVAAGTAALRRAARLAENVGALPVVWPARALLGRLLAQEDQAESSRQLLAAIAVLEQITADLPEDLRRDWLARPDVADLLGAPIVAPVRD